MATRAAERLTTMRSPACNNGSGASAARILLTSNLMARRSFFFHPEQHDVTQVREGALPSGVREHLQQRRGSLQRIDSGPADRTVYRDVLPRVFLDEDRDLGILQVVLAVKTPDQRFGLRRRQAGDPHRADERQADQALRVDASFPAQVLDAQDLHFEKVLGADPVLFFHRLDAHRAGG